MAEPERVWVSPRASESSSATAGSYGWNLRRTKAQPSSSHYRRFRFPRSQDRLRTALQNSPSAEPRPSSAAGSNGGANADGFVGGLPDVGDREWPFQARRQ